jgi:hypothetical protein
VPGKKNSVAKIPDSVLPAIAGDVKNRPASGKQKNDVEKKPPRINDGVPRFGSGSSEHDRKIEAESTLSASIFVANVVIALCVKLPEALCRVHQMS